MRKLFLIFVLVLAVNAGLLAKTNVQGVIADAEETTLHGVNVILKNTTTGTMSNIDALLSYREVLPNGLNFSISGGANIMRQHYDRLEASVTGLITPGVYKLTDKPIPTSNPTSGTKPSTVFMAPSTWAGATRPFWTSLVVTTGRAPFRSKIVPFSTPR